MALTGSPSKAWPALTLSEWSDTCATLHLWLQIVGKIRLQRAPWQNHSWHTTLYVTARGLTTGPMPGESGESFQIDLDFISHALFVSSSDGRAASLALAPQSVASFYGALMRQLDLMGLHTSIYARPNEVQEPIAFASDDVHRSYDAPCAQAFWRMLVQADRVMKIFRGRFIGKCSPVHFFWGAPDLAVTRFSGRRAPEHPGGIPNLPDRVTREAYSHEVSSCGFWPGGGPVTDAAFYAYAYPEPAGFAAAKVTPADAYYHPDMHEFLLPYAAVRSASNPDAVLLEFLQSTYEAAADLAGWDRAALEAPSVPD
jgi:Family of unknown function (DUF5996)